MLVHAPKGDKGLILVDLHAADEHGNVEKASNLKLQTTWRYTAAGEYLIFGGVSPKVGLPLPFVDPANDYKAIISYVPLSRLLSTALNDDDPFRFQVLQSHERLSYARSAIKKDVLPMTYSLGKAVGQLVGTLCVPPKHFENGMCWGPCLRQAVLTPRCG